MLTDDEPERVARTLDEVLEARNTLETYLIEKAVPEFRVGAVGRKNDYGLVVYLPREVDPTFLIPVQIDAVPIVTTHVHSVDHMQPEELRAIAVWYDTHCAVSGDPILQGPCHACGELGTWEVDPYIEERFGREEWNFWCEDCYYDREEQT